MSMGISSDQYMIYRLGDHHWRVAWEGPLENTRPADDAEHLTLELTQADGLRHAPQCVELDLTKCISVNTRGIAFLIYLRRRLMNHGATWSIVNPPAVLRRMLQVFDLDDAFDLKDPLLPATVHETVSRLAEDSGSTHRTDEQTADNRPNDDERLGPHFDDQRDTLNETEP